MRVDQGEISELVRPIEGVFGDSFELDAPFPSRIGRISRASARRPEKAWPETLHPFSGAWSISLDALAASEHHSSQSPRISIGSPV